MKKTNAIRLLEAQGIPFRVVAYEVDPDDLSAQAVAAKLGLEPSMVYKTLVTRGGKGVYFALLPGDLELEPRKLARLAGERKVALVPLKEVQALTGYIRGGVTVLGASKAFPVFVHHQALEHAEISVSAGVRGLQILLDPRDYLRATGGQLGDLAARAELRAAGADPPAGPMRDPSAAARRGPRTRRRRRASAGCALAAGRRSV